MRHWNSQGDLLGQVKKKYGSRLRKCRLRAMIATQKELAKLTGIDRTTISALENNRLFLSSAYALIFKEKLGCSLDDLFELVNDLHDDKDSKGGSGAEG
jgi:DNA-binding XRE family transcriptional regulator